MSASSRDECRGEVVVAEVVGEVEVADAAEAETIATRSESGSKTTTRARRMANLRRKSLDQKLIDFTEFYQML